MMKNSRKLISIAGTLVSLASPAVAFAQTSAAPAAPPNAQSAPEAPNKPAEKPPTAGSTEAAVGATAPGSAAAIPAAPVAAQPPPPAPLPLLPAVAPGTVAPEVSNLTAPPTPAPALPSKLAIGKEGWLQVGALLQGWSDLQWNSGGGPRNAKFTFRMRRAEIKLSGDIIKDTASFLVAFDPAIALKFTKSDTTVRNSADTGTTTVSSYAPPGNTGILKNFWVSLKSAYLEASIGQFKHPISYEGQQSSAELLFAERAYSSRYFGDTYDMGVRLEKKFDAFRYQVFLLNGSGQNQLDTNRQKDLAVRLEATPVKGLMFGAAGLTSIGQRSSRTDALNTTKDRVEVVGKLDMAGVLLQGELLWGKTGATASGNERTKAAGRYVTAGYTIAGKVQPVIRYGYLNTDKTTKPGDATSYALYSPFGVATDEVRSYEAGINYLIQGNDLKLNLSYGYFDFDNIQALQELTFMAQAAF